jgi:hypothetical protein
MRRHALSAAAALVLGASLLSGCESVLGVDFGAYALNSCSPVEATCPGSLACVFEMTKKTFQCAAATGTAQPDEPCEKESDCSPGLACVRFPRNNWSHCSPYCTSTTNTCGERRRCSNFTEPRKTADGKMVDACGPLEPPCDPLAATSECASSGARCTILDTDYTVCLPQNASLGPGSPCVSFNQCEEGTSCVGSVDSGFFCRTLCTVGVTPCPNGACQRFDVPIQLGDDEIGFCP